MPRTDGFFDLSLDPDVQRADAAKKRLRCLGCGTWMETDRCHRICPKCQRRNAAAFARVPVALDAETLAMLERSGT